MHGCVTRLAEAAGKYAYRCDPSVPAFDDSDAIVIFDGVCVLCAGFARWLLRRDRRRRLKFLAAQTRLGEALYRHFGLNHDVFDTYVLLEGGRARVKSDAALRIFGLLGAPWSWLGICRIAPRAWADAVYDWVARNRLQWFGVRDACLAPTAAEHDRFVA